MSNQLLATCGLIIGTTMIIAMGRAKYAWITAVPGLLMVPIVMTAGYMNIFNNFLPKGLYLLVSLSAILMALMAFVFVEAFRKWYNLLSAQEPFPKFVGLDNNLVAQTISSSDWPPPTRCG
jgi:carbon starvation protein